MRLRKCDNCNKEIQDQEKMVLLGYSEFSFSPNEFCFDCGIKRLSKLGQKELMKQK